MAAPSMVQLRESAWPRPDPQNEPNPHCPVWHRGRSPSRLPEAEFQCLTVRSARPFRSVSEPHMTRAHAKDAPCNSLAVTPRRSEAHPSVDLPKHTEAISRPTQTAEIPETPHPCENYVSDHPGHPIFPFSSPVKMQERRHTRPMAPRCKSSGGTNHRSAFATSKPEGPGLTPSSRGKFVQWLGQQVTPAFTALGRSASNPRMKPARSTQGYGQKHQTRQNSTPVGGSRHASRPQMTANTGTPKPFRPTTAGLSARLSNAEILKENAALRVELTRANRVLQQLEEQCGANHEEVEDLEARQKELQRLSALAASVLAMDHSEAEKQEDDLTRQLRSMAADAAQVRKSLDLAQNHWSTKGLR